MKRSFGLPLIVSGLIIFVFSASADAGVPAPVKPGSGSTSIHPAEPGSGTPNYERKKKKKRKKKRRPATPAPAPAPGPATPAPYLLTYEEAHAAIASWSAMRAAQFQSGDSSYGEWYWEINDPSCGWNYYSGTRSLSCTVFYYDYNPGYCHFYFGTNTSWSAAEWLVTARPSVPGSRSIVMGEHYVRSYDCYT